MHRPSIKKSLTYALFYTYLGQKVSLMGGGKSNFPCNSDSDGPDSQWEKTSK